jgi:type II secretory pathway pseudopilin PulG
MKLCSQCEFIYEDDQERCDMDGAELVYEPTLEGTFQTALEAKSERERPARLIIPLLRSPQPETAAARPNAVATHSRFPLQMAAGIVLAVVAFIAFYASPRLFHSKGQTSKNTLETHNAQLETSHSSAAVSGAPATSDKPETSNAKFETYPSADSTESRNAQRETSLPSDKFETPNSKRATPIPALPGLKPLPRLKPLPTLKPIPRLADRSQSVSAGRKTIVVNTSANTKKESRFGSFLKKTGRILSKPFKS